MAEFVLTSRERIHALIAAEPGLHLRELPRRLGLSLRAVRYHVETMAEDDVITTHRSGRYERFFVAGTYSVEDRKIISALRVRGQRNILRALARTGPMRFVTIQLAAAIAPATLVRDLRRLEGEGLIEVDNDRQYRLCDPAASTVRLAHYRERFPDLLADAAREIFEPSR